MTDAVTRLTAALADRYRIERELGQGGMATVYLAEDLKHKRRVAVKVLRPELAAVLGADRFVQEITTTAALQHPHILPLFDSGTADSFLYYVMPYIEGETLRSKLDRETQLGIDEAVRITREVADALDYAHRHGVIHRDIKPENILLHDGRPMVADFGIALAVSAAAGGRMTETGLSLGTPHYMSPEQATAAKEITARSDVYSLGSVLFEMLAGEPPHSGGTAQQIIMKIIAEDAQPVTQLRKAVPANVAAAVARSIEKLPADRFESARAFAAALSDPLFASGTLAAGGTPGAARPTSRRVLEAAGLVALGMLVAAVALGLRESRAAAGGSVERQQVTFSGLAGSPAISPDGRFVAYNETRCPEPPMRAGCVNLMVLEVGTARPVEIVTGADRLASPRWAHDGLTVVFAGVLGAGRAGLFSIPRLGGLPRRIADEPAAFDTHATADSVMLITRDDSGQALRVVAGASGQGAGPAIRLSSELLDVAWSPDGRQLAASGYDEVHVIRRQDGVTLSTRRRALTRAPIRWSTDGRHVLAFRWTAGQDDDLVAFPVSRAGEIGAPRLQLSLVSTLLVARFDVARRTGRVVVGGGSVFYDIWSFDVAGGGTRGHRLTQGTNWHGPPSLTDDGRALYFLRADPLGNSLYRIDGGREVAITAERQIVNNSLRLSRDQRLITFESRIDSVQVLMLHDVASGASRWIPRAQDEDLGWSLPGGEILWISRASRKLWLTDANGGNPREIALELPDSADQGFARWRSLGENWYGFWFLAPDGQSVALKGDHGDFATLVRAPLAGGTVTPLHRFPTLDGEVGIAGWSPDGVIHVARRASSQGTTDLVAVNAATGNARVEASLPAPCDVATVSYAPAGRRAACTVRDQRADVMLLDGIRP